ncbi:MAG: cupin domain-containing protein [Thermoanaerobaculia bacterium]
MSRECTHPQDETLLDLASSQLDRPHQLVLEVHLEHCSACRKRVGELAAPGGWWLEQLPSEAPSQTLWERLERDIAAPPPADTFAAHLPLSPALRQELAGLPKPRWWSFFLNGGRVAVLLEDAATKSLLCLGEMPGGRRFPRHEHLGFEQATVLSGGYTDERGEFVAGDYQSYEPGSVHGPDTLDGDPCWTLFRLEGKVRFRGWRGGIQRLFG